MLMPIWLVAYDVVNNPASTGVETFPSLRLELAKNFHRPQHNIGSVCSWLTKVTFRRATGEICANTRGLRGRLR